MARVSVAPLPDCAARSKQAGGLSTKDPHNQVARMLDDYGGILQPFGLSAETPGPGRNQAVTATSDQQARPVKALAALSSPSRIS